MNPKCRAQLNQARGRPLTDAQAAEIERRLSATMRRLARDDPQQWMATSADQRMLRAAESAMADIKAEADRKVANAQRQALKAAETEQRLQATGKETRTQQLVRDFELTHSYIEGVKRDNTRQLMDLISAADNRQGASVGRQALMVLFDAQNPVMTRDLALEVFAQGKAGTGNAAAKAGAEAWLKVAEAMRQRFNAAGGDVGKLDYGYLPQAHDQVRVMAAGADRWAGEVLPLVDRGRYLREDGARMTDAEVLDVLRGAWESIATDGANKRAPGASAGTGARANRGSESREIHFADGEAYLAYKAQFGVGSMYDAMIGHIGGLARDIGLVERYGPNPEAQMRVQFDLAQRADGDGARVFGNRADTYWKLLNGQAGTPQSARIAMVGQHVRNVETFGKLQGAVLSSITDLGTYAVTLGFNRMPIFEGFANVGKSASKETVEFMNTHGMLAESMISDLNRWAGENVAQSWSGRIANATMRLSLMNAWTDTMRRGFQLTHMQAIGRMREKAWTALDAGDRGRLEAHGLTADDWALIQRAEPVQHRGADFVTPDAIYATGDPQAGQVVAKYLGMLQDESEFAVVNPDMATRAITTFGASQAGTFPGELARAVMQFKSFPIAMLSRHWRRMLDQPGTVDRLAYGGALMASLTMLGAIAFQTKQMVSGKDPVDMTTAKFWTRAAAQGGALGFYGDLLLGDTTDDMTPQQSMFRLLGPTADSAAQLFELTKGNLDEVAAGKPTHAGAEALRFARGHLPLVNMWYAKTAIDQAGLSALQEMASPGYLARVKNKARKDWQQEYWWQPGGQFSPERAPDLGAMAGR